MDLIPPVQSCFYHVSPILSSSSSQLVFHVFFLFPIVGILKVTDRSLEVMSSDSRLELLSSFQANVKPQNQSHPNASYASLISSSRTLRLPITVWPSWFEIGCARIYCIAKGRQELDARGKQKRETVWDRAISRLEDDFSLSRTGYNNFSWLFSRLHGMMTLRLFVRLLLFI